MVVRLLHNSRRFPAVARKRTIAVDPLIRFPSFLEVVWWNFIAYLCFWTRVEAAYHKNTAYKKKARAQRKKMNEETGAGRDCSRYSVRSKSDHQNKNSVNFRNLSSNPLFKLQLHLVHGSETLSLSLWEEYRLQIEYVWDRSAEEAART